METTNRNLGLDVQSELESLKSQVILSAKRCDHNAIDMISLQMNLKTLEETESFDQQLVGNLSTKLRDFSGSMTRLRESGQRADLVQPILKRLYFPTMRARHRKIPEAYEETFTWVFQGTLPGQSSPVKFIDWLHDHNSNEIYWIYGKAGSGKSTLMKFLADHDETRTRSRPWTGDKTLIVAKFFFWHAGTPLQKSQEGLLRSLLSKFSGNAPN